MQTEMGPKARRCRLSRLDRACLQRERRFRVYAEAPGFRPALLEKDTLPRV